VERRSDLRTAFPWARSVICLGLQYDSAAPYSTEADPQRGWIARYAWGDDYHDVMDALLQRLQAALVHALGPHRSRAYADTGPIVERAYAAAAGLGAWGKNTCLLHPEHGSWFFLAEVVTDLDLPADSPRTDMCGSCTACIEACPTDALREPYLLDATRCISYLTIELKGAVPEERRAGIGRHVFGCDICQDVCPWNRKRQHAGPEPFAAREGLMAPDLGELADLVLDEPAFRERFRHSAIKRTRRRGLLRNVAIAIGNSTHPRRDEVLARLARDEDALVQEHARWAIAQTKKPRGDRPGAPWQ
jgi:epoxyqueuosine reductase